jgi:hypothetical protein
MVILASKMELADTIGRQNLSLYVHLFLLSYFGYMDNYFVICSQD